MHYVSVESLTKSYGDKTLFADVTFGIGAGDKIGVIGVNGTGKSTLLKVIAGRESADSGSVTASGRIRIRMLEQDPRFLPGETVLEHVLGGDSPQLAAVRAHAAAMAALTANPEDAKWQQRLVAANQRMDELEAWQMESDAKTALSKLGIRDYDALTDTLSGGQRKRVAMAAALLQPSELLILDEPTNHIDNESVAWLEGLLQKRKGALLMITHDRYFLDRVSNRILELDGGRAFFYEANYSRFLELKLEREEREAASEAKRQNLLRGELAWIRRGAQARSTKQKARIDRFEELRDRTPRSAAGKLDISVASSRLGKKIVELEGVTKRFGDRTLIRGFSYIAVPEDRIGIVGPNGSGKSTLLKLIAGQLAPDEGSIELGQTVKLGWFAQEHETLNGSQRVIECIRETAENVRTADGSSLSASQMLERFLFPPETQWKLVERLSGGEKRRLQLLKILMEAPNVLLLDEPTNDLDIATLTVLEDYLDHFPGVVIAVSHDRYFLDRTVERIFSFEGEGRIVQHTGNYSDYREYMDKQSPAMEEPSVGGGSKSKVPAVGNGAIGATGATGATGAASEGRDRPLRMSYKDQKDFEQIDGWIAEVEAQLRSAAEEMEAANSDSERLQELMARQSELEQKLEKLLNRWTELNELAEQIEAQRKS